jgi:hypothetical protein
MPRPSSVEFRRTVLTLIASMIGGALAGAIAGWTVVPVEVGQSSTSAHPTPPSAPTTSSTTPEVTVIPLVRTPQPTLIPAPFAQQHSSAVAALYHRGKGTEEGLLTNDRLVAQAVAVTSDGWFVVPSSALQGLRPADLVLWHEGHAASTTHIVIDHDGGVAFLKTVLSDVDAPAFARATDVTPGLAVWLERRSRQFEPSGITALNQPLQSLDGVSSETVVRRGSLSGRMTSAGDMGAPIWSANGALVGLLSSSAGQPLSYLPVSAWSGSLSSLLSTGEIRHALLGVRGVNISWAAFDTSRNPNAPTQGAWLREDKATHRPAVTVNTPAADAGLRAGDVIRSIDRDILDASADLGELLAAYRPGSSVTLTVLRGTQTLQIPVTLGSTVTSEDLK